MYEIYGRDKFMQVQCYGVFREQKDCMDYLNHLKQGTCGDTVKFSVLEVSNCEGSEYCEGCPCCIKFGPGGQWLQKARYCNFYQMFIRFNPISCKPREHWEDL